MCIIYGQGNGDYVLQAGTPFSGFAESKAALDRAVHEAMRDQAENGDEIEPLLNWTLHDLRRTAKTLMVRAGVRSDISERVLGHAIAGVEGTYDRHSYADEKRDALETLAAVIGRIPIPLPSSVAALDKCRELKPCSPLEAGETANSSMGRHLEFGGAVRRRTICQIYHGSAAS